MVEKSTIRPHTFCFAFDYVNDIDDCNVCVGIKLTKLYAAYHTIFNTSRYAEKLRGIINIILSVNNLIDYLLMAIISTYRNPCKKFIL